MSFLITEAFVKDFGEGLAQRAQQEMSRLRESVFVKSGIKGTETSEDFLLKRQMTKRQTRHGDTVLNSQGHERRWCTMSVYDDADLIDDPDRVRTLTDPTNPYNQAMSMGAGRKIDEILMDAANAASRTGVDGTGTPTTLPAAHQIASSNLNMNLTKLGVAAFLLDAAEQGPQRYWAFTANQRDSLLKVNEVRSMDYNTQRALVSGTIDAFFGFQFKRVETPILKLTAVANTRYNFAWAKGAIMLAVGADIRSRISERDDKNYSTQVFISMDLGATRLDDTGVVEILQLETAGPA